MLVVTIVGKKILVSVRLIGTQIFQKYIRLRAIMNLKLIGLYIIEVIIIAIMVIYSVILMEWGALLLTNFPTGPLPKGSAPIGFFIALVGFTLLCTGNQRFITFIEQQQAGV